MKGVERELAVTGDSLKYLLTVPVSTSKYLLHSIEALQVLFCQDQTRASVTEGIEQILPQMDSGFCKEEKRLLQRNSGTRRLAS